MERTLYNGFLSGISFSRKEFFYPNPTECDGKYYVYHSTTRQPWFNCSCCPTSVVRFMPAIPGYIYAKSANSIYVNLFMGSSAQIQLGRQTVRISQETNYPWDGNIKIKLDPEKKGAFDLKVRIPGWASGHPVPSDLYVYTSTSIEPYILKINGKAETALQQSGYIVITRDWTKGEIVEINFPMPVQQVKSHPLVTENTGKIALERGPIVYCVESIDNPGNVFNIELNETSNYRAEFKSDFLNGVTVIEGDAFNSVEQGKVVEFKAIPYYAWANRGVSEMRVWFPLKTGCE